jgi:cellobiose epimerase
MGTHTLRLRTKRTVLLLLIVLVPGLQNLFSNNQVSENSELVASMDSSLLNNILKQWYPRSIDSVEGGYFTEFKYDWKKSKDQPKMIVSQSRLIWTSSQAAMFYHDTSYVKYARHGVAFLKNKMWDKKFGGFSSYYNKSGVSKSYDYGNAKEAYGNAFAIYGLSAFYLVSKDTSALELAKKCFFWLEKYCHDSVNGGYIGRVNEDGSWFKSPSNLKKTDLDFTNAKDYNSSIHLLEALSSLYKAWPDSLVKLRLNEMLHIVRDVIVGEKGYEGLFFTPDWNRFSNQDQDEETIRKNSYIDHVSFGHDVETAFLILEASHTLQINNDTNTLRIAKKLVDQSLANGFNHSIGGFYDEGYYFKNKNKWEVLSKNSQWWVHAEGLNALLLMSKIYPEEEKYYEAFLKQWKYINQYVIDKENGEWYPNGLNTNPAAKNSNKGTIWKVNYHNGRALMNCIQLLKDENELVKHFKPVAKLK